MDVTYPGRKDKDMKNAIETVDELQDVARGIRGAAQSAIYATEAEAVRGGGDAIAEYGTFLVRALERYADRLDVLADDIMHERRGLTLAQ